MVLKTATKICVRKQKYWINLFLMIRMGMELATVVCLKTYAPLLWPLKKLILTIWTMMELATAVIRKTNVITFRESNPAILLIMIMMEFLRPVFLRDWTIYG